jgi:hypothetical protein
MPTLPEMYLKDTTFRERLHSRLPLTVPTLTDTLLLFMVILMGSKAARLLGLRV